MVNLILNLYILLIILKINGKSKDLFSEPFTSPEGGEPMSTCLLKQYPQFYQNGRFYAYAVDIENGCEVTHKIELSRDEFERVVYPVLEREYMQRNGLL